jgi:hypothetical protein
MNYWIRISFCFSWPALFLTFIQPMRAQDLSFVELNKPPEFALAQGEKQNLILFFIIKP